MGTSSSKKQKLSRARLNGRRANKLQRMKLTATGLSQRIGRLRPQWVVLEPTWDRRLASERLAEAAHVTCVLSAHAFMPTWSVFFGFVLSHAQLPCCSSQAIV